MCLCDVESARLIYFIILILAYATIALFPDTATGPSMNWPQLPLRVLSSIIIFYYFIIFSYYTYDIYEYLSRCIGTEHRAAELHPWVIYDYLLATFAAI